MSTMNGYFDITDYRHVGDPDDTLAIGRAESQCELAGGGVVYFPPGMYTVSGTTTIAASGVQWRGAGARSSQIVSASGSISPTVLQTASGVSFVTIRDIDFVGNGFATPAPNWQVAYPVIVFSGGACNKVLDCHFKQNTGKSIVFQSGVNGAEVSGCQFYQTGYQDGSTSGPTHHTDAIAVDSKPNAGTCVAISVHDNHLSTLGLGGITIYGKRCDVSHNFATHVFDSGIAFHDNDTRVGLNAVEHSSVVGTKGSQAIDVGTPTYFSLIGNMVWFTDGDGIPINGWFAGTLIGNNIWDSNQTNNDCGIQVLGQFTNPPDGGLTIIGNNSFDDGDNKQVNGVRIFTSGAPLVNNCLLGNNTYNNSNQGILEDFGGTPDDSNTFIGNSDWLERIHTVSPVSTSSMSYFQLASIPIAANSMRERCGIRITAGGKTTGSQGAKHFQFGFGTEGNIFTHDTNNEAGTWELIAVVTNLNSFTSQAAMAMFYYEGTLAQAYEVSLTEQTADTVKILIHAHVSNSADSITLDFVTIERC